MGPYTSLLSCVVYGQVEIDALRVTIFPGQAGLTSRRVVLSNRDARHVVPLPNGI